MCGLAVEEEKRLLAGRMTSRARVGSDVRLELVAGIRARIQAGTYRVAVEDVAERLMGALRG
jgi:anti-sigma28 factor (negative regulator of flagellin synthesis)